MAVVTCDAISRGQCGLVSAIRHDTSHTVHLHPGHCSNTNTSARTCPLSHDSLACLCHDFVLQRTSDPRQVTCVDLCPIWKILFRWALLHITGFHDDHHLNPNLNCLWELRCRGILTEHRPYKVIITTLTVCVRCSGASAHIAFQHFTICPLLVHFCCYLFCFLCCWCFCLILTSVNAGSRGELRAAVSVSLSLIVNATVSASNCQVLKCVASIRTNDNDSN